MTNNLSQMESNDIKNGKNIKNTLNKETSEIKETTIKEVKKRYPKVKKKILMNKILEIKNKRALAKIMLIIKANNVNIMSNLTENSNGVLLLFNALTYETYIKLEEFIRDYEEVKREELLKSQASDDMRFSADNVYSENFDYMSAKLKYSNKEKMLIKRCEYEAIQTN